MTLAVMQPYFFPYTGYFQLLQASDTFVFFDDVNFIKKGWINRNNMLQGGGSYSFSIPLVKPSQNRKINETMLFGYEQWMTDFLRGVMLNYKKAPYYDSVMAMLENTLSQKQYGNIAELAASSVMAVLDHIGLRRKLLFSSELGYSGANGEEKIISICKLLHADQYINPVNGAHLYNKETFREQGISLRFLRPSAIVYPQLPGHAFVPWLSIIDVLMFNSPEETNRLLKKYDLVENPGEVKKDDQ